MTHFKRKKRTRVFSCASECERVFVRGYVCVCMRARVTCNERMVSFLKLFEAYYVIFLDKIHHKNLHACLDHMHISKLAFSFIRFQSAESNKQLNQNILFF